MQIVLKYRVKDKHAAELNRQARAVNAVWNYANETQQKAARERRQWLSAPALQRLTAGSGPLLDLHAHTVQKVCEQYVRSRQQHRKAWLRFRGRKSLGWVPFNTGHVSHRDGAFHFRKRRYDVWLHRPVFEGAKIGAGSFNADARGRWYLNIPVDVECSAGTPNGAVGIDLGLKTLATCSDGNKIEMPRFARQTEERLAKAQRARKKRLARKLHAKVKNQRKDYLHKASNEITRSHGLVAVGDVSPSKLAKTRMAKSVLDAGWSDFRAMLSYKSMRKGGIYVEVPEAYTTQACSECGSIAGPRGRAGLNERMWACSECGADHDRDTNAALNILRLGQQSLGEGAVQ